MELSSEYSFFFHQLDNPNVRLSEAEIQAAIEFSENGELVDYGEFPSPYADSSFYWDGRTDGYVHMIIGQPDHPNQCITLDVHTGWCHGFIKHPVHGQVYPLSLEQAVKQFRRKLNVLQIVWEDVCQSLRREASLSISMEIEE